MIFYLFLLIGLAVPIFAQTTYTISSSLTFNQPAAEGDSGTSLGDTLTVTINPPRPQALGMLINDDGTAVQGVEGEDDYFMTPDGISLFSGTFFFSPDQTDFKFRIQVRGDQIDEPDETAILNLSLGNTPPANVIISSTAGSVTFTIRDDDPTIVSLARTGRTGAVSEGETVEFTVILGRSLIAGEIIDVPLVIAGTGVTNADWNLTAKTGTGLNTGVTLSGTDTATPQVRFSGAGADTATLVLTPVVDGITDTDEFIVALGPDGDVTNGFDQTSLGTNVGGGANPNPSGSRSIFLIVVNNTPPPAAPTGLIATAGDRQVTLNWTDPGNGIIDNWQYRQKAGSGSFGSWTDIPNSTATTTRHTVTGLTAGTEYTFEVRAVAGTANSPSSNQAMATPFRPEVTITGGTAVTEGTAAVFTVSASPVPASNLTVNLSVADAPHADFVDTSNEGSGKSVTVRAGQATANFTIPTTGGDSETTDEPSGNLTVTVDTGTDYTVGSSNAATVKVTDNDPTTVVLTTPDATATEGSTSDRATFRLTLNRALRSGERLQVPLGFSGGTLDTDFTLSLSGSPAGVTLSDSTVTFSGGGGSNAAAATVAEVLLSASQDDDTADETVTVSIPSGTAFTPRLTATGLDGGATGSRTGDGQITLIDNTPEKPVNLTAIAGDGQVSLNWTDPNNSNITGYQFQQKEGSGDYGNWTIILGSTAATVSHTVTGLTNGTVYTLRIRAVAGTTNGVVSEEVTVTPVAPQITITAVTSPVTEGTDAVFTISASPTPASNLMVNLTVTEAAGSDFVASGDEGIKTVTIPAASGSATYTVATMNDDTDEENGSVTVTVANGSGYTVGSTASATVMMNDDDEEETLLGAENTEEAVIFPNPSGRYLEVQSPIGGMFKILSLSGKSLLEGSTNTKVDITFLQSGLYLVQLPDGRLLKFVRE